ncbi:MAG TPA: histidine ammonia-lyase [Blastocatellia bacterium]|nr:histidine ammonia-lyase [Blastocatellia bacterium]HMX27045.1 histidine ammonia-lyase [Blastocatellia bacterium]HMZ20063.1 histidine ammonia-lyase [Blastocatellia bacterium]HNG33102.1 histidine ammonia-lyase [Blastocatellia bacterium]
MPNLIALDGESLSLVQTEAVADGAQVSLTPDARQRVEKSRRFVEEIIARGEVVYGINTGFGALSEMIIPNDQLRELQINLVRSHACGVGDALPERIVRAMMLHRANVLAKGFSGCRPLVVETLIAMLNNGVHPVIPAKGSVGASGDLAPLAHLALVAIGEGEAFYRDQRMPGGEAMEQAGVEPLLLEAKEGLALLNGTQAMTATGGLALLDAMKLADAADVIGAMTLEALRGTPVAFDEKIHAVRPHRGQQASARRLRELIRHSEIRESHRDKAADPRVQDAYALRCIPQVHGAVRDALEHARRIVEVEINSATDNPLVFADEQEVISGGNFHGEPVSLAYDYAAVAIADLATISERRVERLVNPSLSGLPAFLSPHPGTNSGLMIAQVTAAALIAENNVLAHPASVFTLPTSANKEDHVSMGMTAALKLAQIVRNVETVLAIELLCATQGLEFLKPLKPGPKLAAVYHRVRERVPALERDAPLSPLIESLAPLVRELEAV